MRATIIAVVLLAVGAARAEAGGPTLEMKDCTVHKVEAEGNKVVFTSQGGAPSSSRTPIGNRGG